MTCACEHLETKFTSEVWMRLVSKLSQIEPNHPELCNNQPNEVFTDPWWNTSSAQFRVICDLWLNTSSKWYSIYRLCSRNLLISCPNTFATKFLTTKKATCSLGNFVATLLFIYISCHRIEGDEQIIEMSRNNKVAQNETEWQKLSSLLIIILCLNKLPL